MTKIRATASAVVLTVALLGAGPNLSVTSNDTPASQGQIIQLTAGPSTANATMCELVARYGFGNPGFVAGCFLEIMQEHFCGSCPDE